MNAKELYKNWSQELQSHKSTIFSVLLAVVLLMLPNLFAAFLPFFSFTGLGLWAFGLGVPLALMSLGLPVRTILWLASPLLLIGPATCLYLKETTTLPSTFLFLAMQETDKSEMFVFMAQGLAASLMTLAIVAVFVWLMLKRIPKGYRFPVSLRWLVLFFLAVPVVKDLVTSGPRYAALAASQRFLTTYPFSTANAVREAFDIRSQVHGRNDLMSKMEVKQAEPEIPSKQNEIHMLVVGESARRDSFGLYGYERETTPLLKRTPGVMAFQDVTAMATMTLLAVPSILTPTPPGNILATTREPSVLTAYRKAGFKVYWLSTQRKHGTYDTLTSIFSEDADESEFLGGIFDATGRGAYSGKKDIHLLPVVEKILARNESRVLLVLHTMGSHGPYGVRYPKSQEAFKSKQTGVLDITSEMALRESDKPEDLQQLTNAYDNTIFSTDFLLANLIHLLNGKNSRSWFCYLSDHGENGADVQTARFMHGVMTPDVLKVPMVMWLSEEYRRCHPAKAEALQANVSKPFSATCTYHTLLDLGGLSASNLRPEWSAAAKDFKPGPRTLYGNAGNNVIDYDKEVAPMYAETRKGWHPLKPKSVKMAETGAE